MESKKLLDDAKAALIRRADANGDGKVDMQDVESVIGLMKGRAAAETVKHPIGAIVTTAVIVGAIAFALGRAFCGV
jgi:hypothetical protein